MRNNLITRFHCSECGNILNLVYPKDAAEPVEPGYGVVTPSEPTGAACVYTPRIMVEPCRFCIEKYTGPAKQLAKAITVLTSKELQS